MGPGQGPPSAGLQYQLYLWASPARPRPRLMAQGPVPLNRFGQGRTASVFFHAPAARGLHFVGQEGNGKKGNPKQVLCVLSPARLAANFFPSRQPSPTEAPGSTSLVAGKRYLVSGLHGLRPPCPWAKGPSKVHSGPPRVVCPSATEGGPQPRCASGPQSPANIFKPPSFLPDPGAFRNQNQNASFFPAASAANFPPPVAPACRNGPVSNTKNRRSIYTREFYDFGPRKDR